MPGRAGSLTAGRGGRGWCRRRDSNPHSACTPPDFESGASASSATPARTKAVYHRGRRVVNGARRRGCGRVQQGATGQRPCGPHPRPELRSVHPLSVPEGKRHDLLPDEARGCCLCVVTLRDGGVVEGRTHRRARPTGEAVRRPQRPGRVVATGHLLIGQTCRDRIASRACERAACEVRKRWTGQQDNTQEAGRGRRARRSRHRLRVLPPLLGHYVGAPPPPAADQLGAGDRPGAGGAGAAGRMMLAASRSRSVRGVSGLAARGRHHHRGAISARVSNRSWAIDRRVRDMEQLATPPR